MRSLFAVSFGKLIYYISSFLNLGAGGTWPGEVAIRINPNILSNLFESLDKGIIIVAGTNGKTTTGLMIKQILEKNGHKVVHNSSGANLLNGIVSALIQEASWSGKIKADWGVFEVDENTLPGAIKQLNIYSSREAEGRIEKSSTFSSRLRSSNKKVIIVLLNLFRDQLDRYGEVDVIVEKWEKALKELPEHTTLILNSDDPGVAWLGKTSPFPLLGKERVRVRLKKIIYFGLNDPKLFLTKHEHATDSTFCLNCGARLKYFGIFYSHLGHWRCANCTNTRIKPNLYEWEEVLPGIYNKYNSLAAVSVARSLKIKDEEIKSALIDFQPAFGRQEEFIIDGKKVKIFLSKNPTGFNASLRTVLELKPKTILLVLNDRIPDGRDVSWIWDVDFEQLTNLQKIFVSGDRCYDLGLRLKYAIQQFSNPTMKQIIIKENLQEAINIGLDCIKTGETLFILPTYSAMLEVRKIIGGRKIL